MCIYHDNCSDGFAAAWVVRRALRGTVDFHRATYGSAPPDVAGRDVFIVDFSYRRRVLLEMVSDAESLTILDHHISAKDDIVGLPGAITRFSVGLSGCMLAWKYFFPNETPPKLLQHIQDRDLWLFHLDDTREICAALYSFPFDFALFDLWCNCDQLPGLVADGVAIERKNAKDLVELLDSNTRFITFAGHYVPSANLPPYLASAAGNELSKANAFAIIWHDTRDGVRVSLRSQREGGLDVSQIAKIYGGGGHRNAAGFTVSRDLAYQLGITR
jgi:oligoribonuclease NrnB/cAMP/cGMP phosphodiesterase (DHH superfamily)